MENIEVLEINCEKCFRYTEDNEWGDENWETTPWTCDNYENDFCEYCDEIIGFENETEGISEELCEDCYYQGKEKL